jgi:hypothetical protein
METERMMRVILKMRSWREKMGVETEAISRNESHARQEDGANMNAWRKETMSCQEATEANPEKMEANPVEMKSVGVHEEFHMEDATVQSSGTMKKGHRGWHLAGG